MPLQNCGRVVDHSRRELQPHGTPAFPCAGYDSRYRPGPQDAVPWHWHGEIEVIRVMEGRLRVQTPGRTLYLEAGEGVFLGANLLHRIEAERSCHIHALVFHPRLVTGGEDTAFYRKYLGPLMGLSAAREVPFTQEEAAWVEAAFALMAGEAPGWEFGVREALSKICLSLHQRLTAGEERPLGQDAQRLQAMLQYLHEHYGEKIALEQVARSANISTRECLRCFERMAGMPPMRYLASYRVARAAELLKEGDKTIAQISTDCGFDSPSHFAQVFKRHYQVTPRAYRQEAGR